MSEYLSNHQLQWIVSVATDRKKQAVADLDYEEAAMWRDARKMALELLVIREQLDNPKPGYGELRSIADFKSIPTNSTVAWMARELLNHQDKESQSSGIWSMVQLAQHLQAKEETPEQPAT